MAEGPPFAKLFRVPSDIGGNVTRREADGSPDWSGVWLGGGGAGVYEGEGVMGGNVWGSVGAWVKVAEPADLLLLMEGSFGRRGFSFGADIALGVSCCSWCLGD